MGDHEIIKLTLQICFGESYDHYKQSGNIMRHCYDDKKFYVQNQNSKFEKKIFEIPKIHHFYQGP